MEVVPNIDGESKSDIESNLNNVGVTNRNDSEVEPPKVIISSVSTTSKTTSLQSSIGTVRPPVADTNEERNPDSYSSSTFLKLSNLNVFLSLCVFYFYF